MPVHPWAMMVKPSVFLNLHSMRKLFGDCCSDRGWRGVPCSHDSYLFYHMCYLLVFTSAFAASNVWTT